MGKWHGAATPMSDLNAMNRSFNNDRLEICIKNVILVLQTLVGNSSLVTPKQEMD